MPSAIFQPTYNRKKLILYHF